MQSLRGFINLVYVRLIYGADTARVIAHTYPYRHSWCANFNKKKKKKKKKKRGTRHANSVRRV